MSLMASDFSSRHEIILCLAVFIDKLIFHCMNRRILEEVKHVSNEI